MGVSELMTTEPFRMSASEAVRTAIRESLQTMYPEGGRVTVVKRMQGLITSGSRWATILGPLVCIGMLVGRKRAWMEKLVTGLGGAIDPDAAAPVLKRMVEFCGVSIDAAQARHLIIRRLGINNRFDFVQKEEEYTAFGLTRMERMALEQATPFVTPFYPNFAAELAASPRTYPMLRLLRYARKQVGKLPASRRPFAWLKWCFKATTLLRAIVR